MLTQHDQSQYKMIESVNIKNKLLE